MASEHKYPTVPALGWKGLDLRSSDLLRDPDSFSTCQNTIVTKSGSLTSRRGYKAIATTSGGCGMCLYDRISLTTGAKTREKLVLGSKAYKITDGSFAVTYAGVAYTSLYVSILVDSTTETYHFKIFNGATEVLDYDMGLGFDETTPKTMTDLKTAVDAIADFTATITGTASTPCAYLPAIYSEPFSSGTVSVPFEYMSLIPQPATAADPFAGAYAVRNEDYFEFVSSANMNNVIYFGSGWDERQKYDGQKIYRAGMPQPSTPSAAVVVAGSGLTGTNIAFKITFKQVDKQGNSIEGIISEATSAVSPAADNVDVTYSRIAPTSGFNTDCATVNGLQAGVTTITVDSGHTIQIGDIIYLYDTATSAFVTRTVTGTAATTISFAGAVSVADYNAATGAGVISANLRVCVYSQQVSDGEYYLIEEWPHDSTTASPTIRVTQTTWGAQYLDPIVGTEPGLPPKSKYIAPYKNLLFSAGILATPNTGTFSDIVSPEAYPPLSNDFTITSSQQDSFTGLFPTKEYLYIGKENSDHVLTGDAGEDGRFSFRVDDVSLTEGAATQRALAQTKDGRLYKIHSLGVDQVVSGSEAARVSDRISPIFSRRASDSTYELKFNRSLLVYDKQNNQLLAYIPAETSTSGSRHANDNSQLMVLDLERPGAQGLMTAWDSWTNINMEGGAVVADEDLYWVERRYSSHATAVTYIMYKRLNTDSSVDYVDHVDPIDFEFTVGWEMGAAPSVFKLPLRTKIYSSDPLIPSIFDLSLELQVDGRDYAVSTLDFSFGEAGSSGWSYESWSTAPWGAPAEPEMEIKLQTLRSKYYRYRGVHSTRYECPVISAIETEVAVPYIPEMQE